ncbi:MAG TPA: DUF58 domain-containing protein [Armatimonadota bacterium]|nr:DUF58 domain-containing protein [Armatimonadota bacterium]
MSRNLKVFLFAAVVAWVVGVMNEATVMYVLSGVAASIILIAFGLSRLALTRLEAELSVPTGRCSAGGQLPATVHVRSIGNITLPSAGIELTATNLTIPGVLVTRRALLPPLPPGAELDAAMELDCPARGRYRVGPVVLFDSDPIGMFEYRRPRGQSQEIVVLPRVVDLPRLSTWDVQPGGMGGRGLQARRDYGEFRGIREHTPGDDLRHVHWKVTAHTGELAVKDYEPLLHDVVSVHLDLRAANHVGEGADSTLETAIVAAASIAREALADQRLVSLHGEGLPVSLTTPGAGEPQLHRIMLALAEIQANGRRSFTEALGEQLTRVRRGASVFVITTGAEQALAEVLGRAARRGLWLRALLVQPEAEQEPRVQTEGTVRLARALQAQGVGVGVLRSPAAIGEALVAAIPVAQGRVAGVL